MVGDGTSRCCLLCGSDGISLFWEGKRARYWCCATCELVFMGAEDRLSLAEERAQYDLHENDPDDARYRAFLSALANPLMSRLATGSSGLDYGCGPGPALAAMLREAGHRMEVYDPYYAPTPSLLNSSYDFVTATEVVEHFHEPESEFRILFSLLLPGGILGLMTNRLVEREAFGNWHYKNDPTHVCFYAEGTMRWLAGRFGAEVEIVDSRVTFFRRLPDV